MKIIIIIIKKRLPGESTSSLHDCLNIKKNGDEEIYTRWKTTWCAGKISYWNVKYEQYTFDEGIRACSKHWNKKIKNTCPKSFKHVFFFFF
jgi:hypothetical protein